ncbi:potassium-transporting ATPase subunit C [Paenibacillus sambharensis]|uniref:Potassium-transporting ATPase KdpC subunit n=1 Tax=Paenibacillus sambharensis TaxID=1803190 RepID=A0A2W1LDA2_9BACL|nr:potassium-transporting ATPase subunit KdpC [Paenibacillus sambharensis]PZD96783.1 potassium-transporting ATPase subunit C [Paenibacillus sambharensis]
MRTIWITVRTSLVLMLLCTLLYHLTVTGIAQAVLPYEADGSILYNEDNEPIGSALVGQTFTEPQYFHSRVSSIEYDAAGSGSPNYAPSNEELITRTKEAAEAWKQANPGSPLNQLPIDLVTNSGSGLDPHISPEGALVQIPRISERTGIAAAELEKLVAEHTAGRELGIFGEPRVNVLMLNLELQQLLNK